MRDEFDYLDDYDWTEVILVYARGKTLSTQQPVPVRNGSSDHDRGQRKIARSVRRPPE